MCRGHPASGSLLGPFLFFFFYFQAGGKKHAATKVINLRYAYGNFQKQREVSFPNAFFSLKLSQKPTFSSQPKRPCKNQKITRWMRSLCLYWVNTISGLHVCDIMEECREERPQHLPLTSRTQHENQDTNSTKKNVEWVLSSVPLAGMSCQDGYI